MAEGAAQRGGAGAASLQSETGAPSVAKDARPAAPVSLQSSPEFAPGLTSAPLLLAKHSSAPPPLAQRTPAPARPRVIRLTFRRSQSLDADRKRLGELVQLLSKYEGDDRFEIVVEANSHARYQLDFPNNRTRICRELQAELTQRLGTGGWKVEE